MTPTKFTDADYLELNHIISGGNISECSKSQLERFAVMLSRPHANAHFGASSFPQICETVRTLLSVRTSEEAIQVSRLPAQGILAPVVAKS